MKGGLKADHEDEAVADARRWNMSDADIDRIRGDVCADGVWPEHVTIVSAWLLVDTQWRTGLRWSRVGQVTNWIGLDHGAVRASLEAAGIAITPRLWWGLRVMELHAADALNED